MSLPVLVALAGRGVPAPRARVVSRAGAFRAIQPGTPLTALAVVTTATGQSSAWSLPTASLAACTHFGQARDPPRRRAVAPPLAAVLIWFGVILSPRTIGG